MTSEGMVREATDAELDAKMLRDIRDAYEMIQGPLRLTHAEIRLLLRIADERDALRRAACADPDEPHGDPRYVIDTCGACGHEPHGVGYLCIRATCPCRNDRSFQ